MVERSKTTGRQGKERMNQARKDKRYNKFIGFYYVSKTLEKAIASCTKKTDSDKGKTTDRKLLHFITLLPCYIKKYSSFCVARS